MWNREVVMLDASIRVDFFESGFASTASAALSKRSTRRVP